MKKLSLITILLFASACTQTTQIFKYEGKNALTECKTDQKHYTMCEKDGKTLANGIHHFKNRYGDNLELYIDGKRNFATLNNPQSDDYILETENISYHYRKKDKKLTFFSCSEKNYKQILEKNKIYRTPNIQGEELDKIIKKTNGKLSCQEIIDIFNKLKGQDKR